MVFKAHQGNGYIVGAANNEPAFTAIWSGVKFVDSRTPRSLKLSNISRRPRFSLTSSRAPYCRA
jgi:hypothetical protein